MKRPVVWAQSARDEYLHIIRTIAGTDPDAVARVADRIAQAALALGDLAIGRPGRVTGTYEKPLPGLPYIIAYEIVSRPEGRDAIAILHVIHGARDWPEERWPQD